LFFPEPTPQAPNDTEGFSEFCETPQVSHQGGFYSGPVIVSLSINYFFRYESDSLFHPWDGPGS